MGPYDDAIASDEALPAATNVAIIGGGIIGTYAALTLTSRGIPVVLCEKKATSPASNPAATGAGAGRRAATSGKCR